MLSDQAARKRGHRAGNAKPDGNRKARIDAGGFYHIGIVSGGADGATRRVRRKPRQKQADNDNHNDRCDQLIPGRSELTSLKRLKMVSHLKKRQI